MASGLWESERQRAALYVERRRRERLALRDAVFRRINAHVIYTDHAHARRRQDDEQRRHDEDIDLGLDVDSDDAAVGSAPAAGEELALDFLGDVNADDMRSLLNAHAPTPTPAVDSTAVNSVKATEMVSPAIAMALAPLSMPVHLLSTAHAATVNTTNMAGVAVGVSMGEDASVSALMDELQIDVQSLAASTTTTTTTVTTTTTTRHREKEDAKEHKTEESTPPQHVQEKHAQRGYDSVKQKNKSSSAFKKPIGAALEKAWKNVFDPETAAANEMVGWVTGKNDPEVLKRLETLRGETKRKYTKRFGTNTYMEQASIRRIAKYHAGEGDNSSSSSDEVKSDSDFSPQETVEIEDDEDVEDDEPFSASELLVEGELVDEKNKTRRIKPSARRRIRQHPRTKMTIMKKVKAPPSKASKTSKRKRRIVDEEREKEEIARKVAEKKPVQEPADQLQAIDLRSESEAEAEPDVTKATIGGSIVAKPVGEWKAASPTVNTDSLVKLKVTQRDLQKLGKERTSDDTAAQTTRQNESTLKLLHDASVEFKLTKLIDAVEGNGYQPDEVDHGMDEMGDDSDTGTIDLENEEVLAQLDAESKGSPTSTSTSTVSDVLNPVEPQVKMSPQHPTPPSNARALKPESPTSKQAAVSDPETVDFEEVSSELDFGSGASDDFGGDDDAGVVAGEDDGEAEFGQFFDSRRIKQKVVKSVASKRSPPPDATPVEKIETKEYTPTPSPPATASKRQLLVAVPVEKGSNGQRKVPNINTTTVTKRRYKQTRHAIQLLDEDMKVTNTEPRVHDPKANLIARSRLLTNTAPPTSGEVSPRTIWPLQLRRSASEDHGKAGGSARYLNYERTTLQPRPSIKETFSSAAKQARERYDKKMGITQTPMVASQQFAKPPVIFDTSAVGTGAGVLKPLEGSMTSDGVYLPPREPQLDIYQVTGAQSQFDDDAPLSLSMTHKRPTKFAKEIEEAKRNGVNVHKGKPEELDPRAKIPKKSARQIAQERTAERGRQDLAAKSGKRDGDMARKNGKGSAASPSKSKRAKTNSSAVSNGAPSKHGPTSAFVSSKPHESKRAKVSKHDTINGQPSIYGPTVSSVNDSSRHRKDGAGRHGSSDRQKRRRSSSPSYQSSHRERSRDDRDRGFRGARDDDWKRGRDREREERRDPRRDRSRSPSDSRYRNHRSQSPLRHSSSHDRQSSSHRRSRSRSRSPTRFASRDERQHRDDRRDDRRSLDDTRRSLPTYELPEDFARSTSDRRDGGKEARVQPRVVLASRKEGRKIVPVVSVENDDSSDIAASDIEFVDDFDDNRGPATDINIKYKLEDLQIDDGLRLRMVYVCNLSPQVDEEHITELFQKYGIADDDAIGCPAVDVFLCQRSHRPRGDARITFSAPQAAAIAAEEMNFFISGNCKLAVREMDTDTMRVLQAQFDMFRDTWMCPNPDCRAESSTWTRVCGQCKHHRVFPPSNVKVRAGDWLCSICFATNALMSSKCSCCNSLLPLNAQEKAFHAKSTTTRHERPY